MRSPRHEDDFCSASSLRDTKASCGGHSAGDSFIEGITDAVGSQARAYGRDAATTDDVHDAARYLGMTEDAVRHKPV